MMNSKEMENSIPEIIKVGSEAFEEQLVKMTKAKVIVPYSTLEFYRLVIDLYRRFADGNKPSEVELSEAQSKLNCAIDHAKVNDLPTDDLENLKNDINHLKYELI